MLVRENLKKDTQTKWRRGSLTKTFLFFPKTAKLTVSFTIVSPREIRSSAMLWGTGQHLPTMSVEEYLDEEMKRGGIIQGGGPSSKKDDSYDDEDDEDKADQKTYKARQWDEFVEANPKGYR